MVSVRDIDMIWQVFTLSNAVEHARGWVATKMGLLDIFEVSYGSWYVLYTIRACIEQEMKWFQSKIVSIDIQSALKSCTIADFKTLNCRYSPGCRLLYIAETDGPG